MFSPVEGEDGVVAVLVGVQFGWQSELSSLFCRNQSRFQLTFPVIWKAQCIMYECTLMLSEGGHFSLTQMWSTIYFFYMGLSVGKVEVKKRNLKTKEIYHSI